MTRRGSGTLRSGTQRQRRTGVAAPGTRSVDTSGSGLARPPAQTRGSGPYSVRNDPVVVTLLLIVAGSLVFLLLGIGITPAIPLGNDTAPAPNATPTPEPETVRLAIRANRTRVHAGEPVEFTVLAGGTPVAGANVTARGKIRRTGPNGTAVYRFRTVGDRDVATFYRDGPPGINYVGNATRVTVVRRPVELSLRANVSTATAGDRVAFRVTRNDTDGPADAVVEVGGRDYPAGPDGRVVVTVDRAGRFDAVATSERTATERFVSGETSLAVDRRVVGLAIDRPPGNVSVGDSLRVSVRRNDTGAPVTATLSVGGDRTVSLGPDGETTLTLDSPGPVTIAATARRTDSVRFTSTQTSLYVTRERVPLALDLNRTAVDRGDAVAVVLRRAADDVPVTGVVEVNGTVYETDVGGEVVLRLDRPGRIRVRGYRANTSRTAFLPATGIVTVSGPWFRLSNLSAPRRATPGEEIAVGVSVRNAGDEPGTVDLAYAVANGSETGPGAGGNATVAATRRVDLEPDAQRRITVPVRLPDDVGGTVTLVVDSGDDRVTARVVVE